MPDVPTVTISRDLHARVLAALSAFRHTVRDEWPEDVALIDELRAELRAARGTDA